MSRVRPDRLSDTGNALEKNAGRGEARGALGRASFLGQLQSRDLKGEPR